MTLSKKFNAPQGWQERVIEADKLWHQVERILKANKAVLPETPRCPDVRLTLQNISGMEIRFTNPIDHSNGIQQVIPADGDKRAVMIMPQGDSIEEQSKNAKALYDAYDLGRKGLSQEFLDDMAAGKLAHLLKEAYGPSIFDGNTSKLTHLVWEKEDGNTVTLSPEIGAHGAFGARAAVNEKVFLAQFHIYVKGTTTTPELVESHGMNIAVGEDYNTKKTTTRPIVPSVAKTYYGAHTPDIPRVLVSPEGRVREVRFKDGSSLLPKAANPPKKTL